MSQGRQLPDEHFRKFDPYVQVLKWLSPGGKIMSLNSPVRGNENGRELFPRQEIMAVIQCSPRQGQ